jgi:hypothetical protein
LTLLVVLAAAASTEGADLRIDAGEVSVDGRMDVKSVSNIKNIGQGSVQIRDKAMKTSLLIGASTRPGAGPAQRMQSIEGTGIAVTAKDEKGGVHVAASTGRVGVNDASSKLKGNLHVGGDITTEILVAPYSGKSGPAVLLETASKHTEVVLGKPESEKLQYAIGRGQLADRAMTFSTPNVADYDGAGKAPYIMYQSPKRVLAAFKAGTADLFLAGNMGLQTEASAQPWKSGTKSNMHVGGSVRLEAKAGTDGDDVALFYPATGKSPSFNVRTGTTATATAIDTKLFVGGGKSASVGVNTLTPKTRLDIRGHLNLQGEDKGSAVVYFPSGGRGFFIRSTSKPDVKNDAAATLFFIHPKGKVGVNTIEPKHGLCLHPKAGTVNGADLLIRKGNLHLNGGVRDLDEKHELSLDGKNNFHSLNVETGFAVGLEKPGEATKPMLHIQGSMEPKLLISQEMMKPVTLLMQLEKNSWKLEGTTGQLNLASSKPTQSKFFFTKAGNIVVGDKEKPEFALQIETDAKEGDPANSIYVAKGGLRIRGAVNKMSTYKGKPIVWRLYPSGFSNMKDLGVRGKLVIGSEKKFDWAIYVEKGRTIDVGKSGFVHASDGKGTLSFNEYIVSQKGQKEIKLRDKKAFASAVRAGEDGVVTFEATPKAGDLAMSKLMRIDPAKGIITFDKYTNFGLSGGAPFPFKAKGGSSSKLSTIAFGHISNSMGLLGATSQFSYLGARDEKKFVAIQHNGNVGLGTTTATEELTVRTSKARSDIHLTSASRPGSAVLITMEETGSTKFSIAGSTPADTKSGKFLVQDYSKLTFSGKAATVFDRGNAPAGLKKGATFNPPHTEFRTGKVGLGVTEPKHHLHVGGNHWAQGKMIVKNGFGRASMMAEAMSMLELGEGSTELQPEGTDVGHAIILLTRLVRKNKLRLAKQASAIAMMEQEMDAQKMAR